MPRRVRHETVREAGLRPGLIRMSVGQGSSLLTHLAAACLFTLDIEAYGFPPGFDTQLLAALAVSAVLTLVTCFTKRQSVALGLLGLQLFAVLVIGYPMGERVEIELVLFIGLLVLTAEVLDGPANLIFSLFTVAAAVLSQQPVLAWGNEMARPGSGRILFVGIVLSVLLALIFRMNRLILRYREENRRNRQLETAVDQLTNANLGFQEYAYAAEERSRASERDRITREIHDVVGYTLTNITMMMEDAIDTCRSDGGGEILPLVVNSRDQARNGHEEIRQALRRLRSIETCDTGALNAIHRLVKTFEKATGVRIDIDYSNVPFSLPEETGLCLYRLIQEGMTNAFRHGKATQMRIILSQDEGTIVLSVSDNGMGSGEIVEGIGIAGMKERVEKLHGEIRFESARGGFRFTVRLPEKSAYGTDPSTAG